MDKQTATQREKNYNRMTTGIMKYGAKCKRQLLNKHLKTLNLSLQDFLIKYQHILYHLCFNRPCACNHNTKCALPRNRVLYESQLETLFEKQSNVRLPGHKGKRDFCCCNVKQIETEDLEISLLHCILINCCLDVFWNCCLTECTLEKFLNINMHDVYHMSLAENDQCKMCTSNCKLKVNISNPKIRQDQFDKLYYPVNNPNDAIARIKIETFDLENNLACALLNVLCPLKIKVEQLLSIRNTHVHATKHEIDNETFDKKWKELSECLLYIAQECNMDDEIKLELHELRHQSLDGEQELRKTLQDMERKDKKEKVNNFILITYFFLNKNPHIQCDYLELK